MKLLAPLAAIIAAAAAGHIYTTQPSNAYAHSAEIYQTALEHQQQGLYSTQPHGLSASQESSSLGHDQSQAYNQASAYSGQSGHGHFTLSPEEHAYSGQSGHEQTHYTQSPDLAYAGQSHRPSGEKSARILGLVSESDGHGYHYSFETENGIKAQEAGQIKSHESGTEAHGSYSYTGDDGHVYTVTYTADEHGFRAQGAHLPTSPPIPEAIAKSLEQNAKDEASGVYDDGKYVDHHHISHQEHHQTQKIHHEPTLASAGHQKGHYQPSSFHHGQGYQQTYSHVPVEGYHKH